MSYDIMFHMTGIYLVYDRFIFSIQTLVSFLSNGCMSSISTSNIYNESFRSWEFFFQELYDVQENYGIWQVYTTSISGIYQGYHVFQLIAVSSQKKPWNCHHKSDPASTNALRCGGQHAIPSRAAEAASLPQLHAAFGPAGSPKRADFLRIFSVLATERLPTRGWGLPKFHNQVLI